MTTPRISKLPPRHGLLTVYSRVALVPERLSLVFSRFAHGLLTAGLLPWTMLIHTFTNWVITYIIVFGCIHCELGDIVKG